VAGVALATVIAQCISAGLVVWCMMRESGGVHLDLCALRIYKVRLKQILQVGLPAGLQSTLFAFSNVVIQSSINLFGETVVAGSAAAGNIEGFVYISMNAFYQGAVSFTSQNYGAGRYERLRPILYRALACAVVTGVVLGGATVIFAPQLLRIYSDSAVVIATGVERLRIICLLYFLCGTMEVLVGALRGLGYSVMPMIVSLIGACGLRVLWVATVFQIPAFHKVTTVYWSYPVSWTLTIIAHLCCYVWAYKRLKRQIEMKTLRT
jgi:Na+-driven multidrug efflux pump